jgi:ribonuclease T2
MPSSRNLRQSEELSERSRPRSLRRRLTFLVLILSACFVLALAGCQTAVTRDARSTLSASATLVAVPTKAPTRTALTPTAGRRVKNTPGDFDFYVMDLSWSPDYCAGTHADDPQQCSLGKKLGFVLHGLWPQYTRGYPSDCSNVTFPQDVQAKFPNLYPSAKLYTHEWDKHGTCSGLKPLEYLTLSQSLKESIAIPPAYRNPARAFRATVDDLKAAFVGVNSSLSEDALAVQCSGSGRFLKELVVCFSRDGQPTACSAEIQKDAAKSCGRADFLVRNVK